MIRVELNETVCAGDDAIMNASFYPRTESTWFSTDEVKLNQEYVVWCATECPVLERIMDTIVKAMAD